jgi:hypothetical protein
MNSAALVAECDGLTYRKLDYWCHNGIFGDRLRVPGRSNPRTFTDEDIHVARVLARISLTFDSFTGARGGWVNFYTEIANQIRSGSDVVDLSLGRGVTFCVDIDEVLS